MSYVIALLHVFIQHFSFAYFYELQIIFMLFIYHLFSLLLLPLNPKIMQRICRVDIYTYLKMKDTRERERERGGDTARKTDIIFKRKRGGS